MSDNNVELDYWKPNFINNKTILDIESKYTLPVYIYSEKLLNKYADEFLSFPSAFWKTVRYAMKANSNLNILKIFNNRWIKIDASSEYEVWRVISAWYNPEDISISTQETPKALLELINLWVFINATSLNQIKKIWKIVEKLREGLADLNTYNIWVRINPWVWSWAFKAISTWGKTSAFWIWHEYILEIKNLEEKFNLNITKIHIHIWSENTPESWTNSANIWLEFVSQFINVDTLDLWWGFKRAIMPYEESADLQAIWESVANKFKDFYKTTWRKIHLEIEPGKSLVINTCSVISEINDIVNTWKSWYNFIRLNSGMTEMPRVSMYWVQEPIYVFNKDTSNFISKDKEKYVVVWHCCESWDILTSKLYEQEIIESRRLNKASIWDLVIIDWVWAYNSSMSMKNYNSFPESAELLLRKNGEIAEIRKRQELKDIWRNEIDVI